MASLARRRRFGGFPKVRYRTRHIVRRAGSTLARKAMEEKHTLAAAMTAFAFGYLESRIDIPVIGAIGKAGTAGLALWVAGRYTGNRMIRHAATGMLAVAAAQMGRQMAGGATAGEDSVDF